MNEVAKTENKNTDIQLQVEQKKNELATVLQSTILEQYAYDLNSQTPESFKTSLKTEKPNSYFNEITKI